MPRVTRVGSPHRNFVCFSMLLFAFWLSVILPAAGSGSSNFKIIYTFHSNGSSTDPNGPQGSLIRDARGNLYGASSNGGTYGAGTVFELSPNADGTWSNSILYSFTGGTDGQSPNGLVFDDDGNLYGTTSQGGDSGGSCLPTGAGCGVVFELSPSANGWTYILLHSFNGPDGAGPTGSLVLDTQGNLYGTTINGGFVQSGSCFGGCGVAYELIRRPQWQERILHTFFVNLFDGRYPIGGLAFDGAGNLYGATLTGGAQGGDDNGSIYELSPTLKGPYTETVLYSFCGTCGYGTQLSGGPIFHNGAIYGATTYGGINGGSGAVFELLKYTDGWQVRSEYSFSGTNGEVPLAPVLLRDGRIFGVTQQGGLANGVCTLYPTGNGVVYELAPANGAIVETVLYEFTGGSDGCGPSGGLLSDPEGNLYGTVPTSADSSNWGVVFEITR